MVSVGCSRQNAKMARMQPVFETQVKNAVRVGDGDSEIQALRKRLMDDPKNTALRRMLAEKFEAAGYPDLALEHLRLAHEAAPQDEALTIELAKKLNEIGFRTQADQVLEDARKGGDAGAELVSYAAITKDGLKEFAAGEALHREALQLEAAGQLTGSVKFENNLAYNLMEQGQLKEAEAKWRAVLEKKPTYELARNNLAKLYATKLNQPEEALAHWKAVSGPAAAHNNLAAVYIEQGRYDEARKELEKALAMRFQFPEAVKNLQILAGRTGGTVELKLKRDKHESGLTKLAKAIKTVFIAEDEKNGSRTRRSQ